MNDQNADLYRQKIEREATEILRKELAAGKMKADRAREIAQYILKSLHPGLSIDDLYIAVVKLDDNYPELAPIVIEFCNEYEAKIQKAVSKHVHSLMKQKRIQEATEILKAAVDIDK